MCGGFPNSTTRGKPLPPMTFWETLKELWRELRGGRWYDAPITRPTRNTGGQ